MWAALAKRYYRGLANAAAIGIGSPASGAIALSLHAMGHMIAVMVAVLAFVVPTSVFFGDTAIGRGAVFALIVAGMVPTAFLMLETLRALHVWMGGPREAAALHARLLAQLERLEEKRHE